MTFFLSCYWKSHHFLPFQLSLGDDVLTIPVVLHGQMRIFEQCLYLSTEVILYRNILPTLSAKISSLCFVIKLSECFPTSLYRRSPQLMLELFHFVQFNSMLLGPE